MLLNFQVRMASHLHFLKILNLQLVIHMLNYLPLQFKPTITIHMEIVTYYTKDNPEDPSTIDQLH